MKYDIVRQKRRFEMFDKNCKKEVIELNDFFGRYSMRFEGNIKKLFVYYDTPNRDLFKSGIALFKSVIGKDCTLTMTRERLYRENNKLLESLREEKSEIDIKPNESILKYMDFLRNAFLNMFSSIISFDPDYLLKKLQIVYTIKTITHSYKATDGIGLKVTYSFDEDTYYNAENKRTVKGNYLTVYQNSKENTDDDYENLISKLIRYCKSLTLIKESKIEICRAKTKLVPITPKKDETLTKTNSKKKNKGK